MPFLTFARRRLRPAAWLALVAMLALALAPTLSRAVATANGNGGWAEVCTPQGLRWVSADGQRREAPPDGVRRVADPCHYCQLATSAHAPLGAAAPSLVAPPASEAAPRCGPCPTGGAHAWRRAQPRAPPARG